MRFVVLRHDHPFPHWDLMLERDEALRTWRLTIDCPWMAESEAGGEVAEEVRVERLPDHRIEYLDYEGPVSGDRGRVDRVDAGELRWLDEDGDRIELDGGRLAGRFEFVTVEGDGDYLRRLA